MTLSKKQETLATMACDEASRLNARHTPQPVSLAVVCARHHYARDAMVEALSAVVYDGALEKERTLTLD